MRRFDVHPLALVLILLAASMRAGFAEQLAPTIEPLRPELVGVLFERVNRRDTIEFELL